MFGYLILANIGGVGGAGVQLPIIIAFMKMSVKNAVPLSNFSIFVSSTLRYFINARKPHPLKKGKGILVDYDLCIIMIPMIVAGSMLGATANTFLPSSIINILFITLMICTNILGVFNIKRVNEREKK